MSRKKRVSSESPIRLPNDVTDVANRLSSLTGWSFNAAVAFLGRAGWNAVGGKGDKITSFKQLMNAAVDHHEAEIAAKKKLAITSSKLQEARKALPPISERR